MVTLEFPHLLRLIERRQYDTIYHEHFSYLSLLTSFPCARDGRAAGGRRGRTRHARRFAACLRPSARERRASRPSGSRRCWPRRRRRGCTPSAGHEGFAPAVLKIKSDLLGFLLTAAGRGRSVAGYGAPGKGNTLLNHCGIRSDLLSYTVDRSPVKQGKFLPGTHIPIYAPERLAETKPDYILVLPGICGTRSADSSATSVPGAESSSSRSRSSKSFLWGVNDEGRAFLRWPRNADAGRDPSGPKPMAMVGDRPLMWHVMRYYAHFGHTDFVLCLGYGASYVKDFFLNYDETRSNDFVLEGGDHEVKLFRTDISDWRITFVDTGLNSADRRAAAAGPPVRRRRADVPGQLRGRLHRRAAAGHDPAVRGQQCGGQPARGAAAVLPPRGRRGRGRPDHPGHPGP